MLVFFPFQNKKLEVAHVLFQTWCLPAFLTGLWTNLYYYYLRGIHNTVYHILPQMDETEKKTNSSCIFLLLLKLLGKVLIYKKNAPQITIFAIKSSTSMPHRWLLALIIFKNYLDEILMFESEHLPCLQCCEQGREWCRRQDWQSNLIIWGPLSGAQELQTPLLGSYVSLSSSRHSFLV